MRPKLTDTQRSQLKKFKCLNNSGGYGSTLKIDGIYSGVIKDGIFENSPYLRVYDENGDYICTAHLSRFERVIGPDDILELKPARNINAVHHFDKYYIYNNETMEIVESCFEEPTARRLVNTLNDHEEKNNRCRKYRFLPKKNIKIISE